MGEDEADEDKKRNSRMYKMEVGRWQGVLRNDISIEFARSALVGKLRMFAIGC